MVNEYEVNYFDQSDRIERTIEGDEMYYTGGTIADRTGVQLVIERDGDIVFSHSAMAVNHAERVSASNEREGICKYSEEYIEHLKSFHDSDEDYEYTRKTVGEQAAETLSDHINNAEFSPASSNHPGAQFVDVYIEENALDDFMLGKQALDELYESGIIRYGMQAHRPGREADYRLWFVSLDDLPRDDD